MKTTSVPKRLEGQEGFLLLDVLVAIVIFSVGILAVRGLQAVIIKHSTDARLRSIASLVAEERISEMWADPANVLNKIETDTNIEPILPNGTRTVERDIDPLFPNRYTVTVGWWLPTENDRPHRFVTVVNITGG